MSAHRPKRRTVVAFASLAALGLAGAIAVAACAFKSTGESPEQSACLPMAEFLESCGQTEACSSAVTSQCSQVSGSLSDSLINALIDCEQSGSFCDAGSALASPCVIASGVSPTSAQAQIATDFCGACLPAVAAAGCEATFYAAGGVGVASAPVFAASDAITVSIDQTCAAHLDKDAGSAACTAAFVGCARSILQAQLVIPASCSSGAGLLPALPGDSE